MDLLFFKYFLWLFLRLLLGSRSSSSSRVPSSLSTAEHLAFHWRVLVSLRSGRTAATQAAAAAVADRWLNPGALQFPRNVP